ncbi:MAG: hypothetical protein LBD11_03380 [Candidatus Peribacteria bacterium]|jgi:hypothetical protein|nr:hypothetical protein [Candidatus Peribacteria bacterium]
MQNEIRSSLGKRRQNLKKNHSERVSQQQQLQIKETFLELSSGEAWLKAYGGDILQYLQAFYPPEMTEKKIKN